MGIRHPALAVLCLALATSWGCDAEEGPELGSANLALDSDGDGIQDADEEALGLDPVDPDSDDDGLVDTTDNNGDGVIDDFDHAAVNDDEDELYQEPSRPEADAAGFHQWVAAPGTWSTSFTNPFLIDRSGDGWTAPGLGSPGVK